MYLEAVLTCSRARDRPDRYDACGRGEVAVDAAHEEAHRGARGEGHVVALGRRAQRAISAARRAPPRCLLRGPGAHREGPSPASPRVTRPPTAAAPRRAVC